MPYYFWGQDISDHQNKKKYSRKKESLAYSKSESGAIRMFWMSVMAGTRGSHISFPPEEATLRRSLCACINNHSGTEDQQEE